MGGYPLRPPTHRRNGGPLPRRLPNGTHAHPHPPKLSIQNHAAPDDHGGLIRLSAGYTPDAGRLHTRYAPVRRSPPGYCYPALPLDLHVLGLPLAFILSQDQTLRCLKIYIHITVLLRLSESVSVLLSYQGLFQLLLALSRRSSILVRCSVCCYCPAVHHAKERAARAAYPCPPLGAGLCLLSKIRPQASPSLSTSSFVLESGCKDIAVSRPLQIF